MMTTFIRTAFAVASTLALLVLGGCATGTNQNFDTYGDPLGAAEITDSFSGNFLPFRAGPNGTYLAADGRLSSIRGGGAIGVGTWGVEERGICFTEVVTYRENGLIKAEPPFTNCYFVFSDGNGSLILDPVGMGPNIVLPPGTLQRGFAGQAEFNRLRADLGV